jgi:hypothetical protein
MKLKISMISSSLCLAILAFFTLGISTSYADEFIENEVKVKVTVTNNETGEVRVAEEYIEKVSSIQTNTFTIQSDDSVNYDAGFDVFVPIEDEDEEMIITPFANKGSTKTSGGVTARVSANYDIRNNGQEIRVNKMMGGWTPSHSMYIVEGKKASVTNGAGQGKRLNSTFASNVRGFEVPTGWGYNYFIGGDASPRAWTNAVVRVSGMNGTHNLEVEVLFP